MDRSFSLADLRKSDTAIITKIQKTDAQARLRDMGFSEGARVTCIGSGIFGDPAAYLVKGALIALRHRDAEKILCERADFSQ